MSINQHNAQAADLSVYNADGDAEIARVEAEAAERERLDAEREERRLAAEKISRAKLLARLQQEHAFELRARELEAKWRAEGDPRGDLWDECTRAQRRIDQGREP